MDAREPNLYVLHGYVIQVTFSTTSLSGKRQLTYHDATQARQFSGDDVTVEDTVLGQIASVVLSSIPDLGTTIFSLVLPAVQLPANGAQPISTIGITAVQRTTIAGPPQGQLVTLQVTHLSGTADAVIF